MDFNSAITRLMNIYRVLSLRNLNMTDLGLYSLRYITAKGVGFLHVIISDTKKKLKGKERDLEIIIEKSRNTNKLIMPKEFLGIRNYLSMIFPQIVRPPGQILDFLRDLMAGLRLEIIPFQNLKYIFIDPSNPEIMIFDDDKNGQYSCYINMINIKDVGLILAHERQIEFIKQQIIQGVNPIVIHNLPPLRTGATQMGEVKKLPIETNKEQVARQRLQDILHEKKTQQEIEKELGYATVIDSFSPNSSQKASIPEPVDEPQNIKPKTGNFSGFFPFPNSNNQPQHLQSNNPLDQVKDLVSKDIPNNESVPGTKFIQSKIDPAIEKLKEQINVLEMENEILKKQSQETTDSLSQMLQVKDEELQRYKSFSSKNKDAMTKLMDDVQLKAKHLQEMNQKNFELQENLKFISIRVQDFQNQINEKDLIIKQISSENAQLNDSIQNLIDERVQVDEQMQTLQTQYEENKQLLEEQKNIVKELLEKNELLTDQLKEIENKYQILFDDQKNRWKDQIIKEHKEGLKSNNSENTTS